MSTRIVDSYTLTTGTQSSGTFADVIPLDGVYHSHTDTAGVMDLYYVYRIGGGAPTSVTFVGYLNSFNDALTILGYNWETAAWVEVGLLQGTNASVNEAHEYKIHSQMVGTGANQGEVRVRFYAASGLTSATLNIDNLTLDYSLGADGYANGAVWFDSNASNTSTEVGIDGTSRNPVSSVTALLALLGSTSLNRVEVNPQSTLTLDAAFEGYDVNGGGSILALGGQNIGGTIFSRLSNVTGTGTTTGSPSLFEDCVFGNVTISNAIMQQCGYGGTFTISSTGDYTFIDGYSNVAGSSAPVFDLGAAIAATTVEYRRWSGGATFNNFNNAGDIITLEGIGGTVTVNGTDGELYVRGGFEAVVDNTSAGVVIVQTANINRASLTGYEMGFVYIDASASNTGVVDYVDGTADNPVSTIAAARTIADSLGLRAFFCRPGTTITLDQAYDNWTFEGVGATVALNSQSVSGSRFNTITPSGVGTGANRRVMRGCLFNNCTFPTTVGIECVVLGTFTMSDASFYRFDRGSAASSSAIFDFGAAVGSTQLYLHAWSGAAEITNLGQSGTDTLWITGDAELTINANCIGGTVYIAGDIRVINNGTGITIVRGMIQSDTVVKGAALSDITLQMVLSSDHVSPATGLTVTAQRSLDGSSYVNVSGTISEISNGTYSFDAAAADTNCDSGMWKFSGTGADDTFISFFTTT